MGDATPGPCPLGTTSKQDAHALPRVADSSQGAMIKTRKTRIKPEKPMIKPEKPGYTDFEIIGEVVRRWAVKKASNPLKKLKN